MVAQELDDLPTQKPTSGGSSETEKNEPTASPAGLPSVTAATTVTPVGKWPSTLRNSAESMAMASSDTCTPRSVCAAGATLLRPLRGLVRQVVAPRLPVGDHRAEVRRVVDVLLVGEPAVARVLEQREVVLLVDRTVTGVAHAVPHLAHDPAALLVDDVPIDREVRHLVAGVRVGAHARNPRQHRGAAPDLAVHVL